MTPEEMEKVAKIALTVDSWCSNCQHDIFAQLRAAFPEHVAILDLVKEHEEIIHRAYYDQQAAFWNDDGPQPDVLRTKSVLEPVR